MIVQNFKLRSFVDRLDELKPVLEWWKEGVPFNDPVDQGQIQVGTQREGVLVDLSPAANKYLTAAQNRVGRVKIAQTRDGLHSGDWLVRSSHNYGRAIGQAFAN